MNVEELVREDLVIFSKAKTKSEVLSELSDLLIVNKHVKASYKDAVLEREEAFPTGLETEKFGVAIPHTDSIHVNEPAVAIALLEKKLPFIQMGTSDEVVQVEVIFMLALKKAEDQLEVLQVFIDLIQNDSIMKKLVTGNNPKEIIKTIQEFSEQIS
ncbi:PTS sugar transporter subunit IIA [Enterococcus sp. AZ196]|uniref:PTS sugar transporter subunit IIA n=1 Tax=Enterococcus sp. AZ196 TaxID=2774659 RepID=UPI003D2E61A0